MYACTCVCVFAQSVYLSFISYIYFNFIRLTEQRYTMCIVANSIRCKTRLYNIVINAYYSVTHVDTIRYSIEMIKTSRVPFIHRPTGLIMMDAYVLTSVKFQNINNAGWRHPIETFSALPAVCERNPPVIGGFPSQRPVTRTFEAFFILRRLNEQSRRRWFETPSHSVWRHCNALCWLYCDRIVLNK